MNDGQIDDLHTSTPFLTLFVYILVTTAHNIMEPRNYEACAWKKWDLAH